MSKFDEMIWREKFYTVKSACLFSWGNRFIWKNNGGGLLSHFSHCTLSLSFFHVYLCHFVFSYQLHLYSFHLCLCLCVCLCIYLREVVGRSSMTNMAATLHRLLITLITQMCLSPPTYILYNDFLLFFLFLSPLFSISACKMFLLFFQFFYSSSSSKYYVLSLYGYW